MKLKLGATIIIPFLAALFIVGQKKMSIPLKGGKIISSKKEPLLITYNGVYVRPDGDRMVFCLLDGTVIAVGTSPDSTKFIVLRNSKNIQAIYYGFNTVFVNPLQKLIRGSKMGELKANHDLHIVMAKGTRDINPSHYFVYQ
jgi:hypothetical protein